MTHHEPTPAPTRSGVTPSEAARLLGVKPDAIRSRLRRGTLAGERQADGNWLVFLPASERVTTRAPERVDAPSHDDALIDALRREVAARDVEVAWLRDALDARSRELAQERERFDVIHREALGRIAALSPGGAGSTGEEPPGSPVATEAGRSGAHAGHGGTAPGATPAPAPRPGFWARMRGR